MYKKPPYYVLGLDPGIASCGFALLDTANQIILEMNAHVFDAPQNNDKVSLARIRRGYRSKRRNNDRTKNRLNYCIALLINANLIPEGVDKSWFQTKKGDRPILELRAKGLGKKLTNREFAQILYSLCKRRGYIPHGKTQEKDKDNDEKNVLKAIDVNTQKLNEYQTVGEMLEELGGKSRNKENPEGKSEKDRKTYDFCVLNSQIQDEIHKLFEAQRKLGKTEASKELESSYIECLVWEKSVIGNDERSYLNVGGCTYYSDKKRAAAADISSELCKAYECFGNIVVVKKDGSECKLTHEQIAGFVAHLFQADGKRHNVTYKKIRKDIKLSSDCFFKSIDRDQEGKAKPFEPERWNTLIKSGLSTDLLKRMIEDRDFGDSICEALTFASSAESLEYCLSAESFANFLKSIKKNSNNFPRLSELCKELSNKLSDEERQELIGTGLFTNKLFKGYGRRSRVALNALIKTFQEGATTLGEAEKESGLLQVRLSRKKEKKDLLPPYSDYDKTCKNPVVLRSLSRMRKIINSIIREYGVPHEIHIEVGKELKHSKREKDIITKRQKKNKETNKRLRNEASKKLGVNPEDVSGRLILKMLLREEQKEKDLYSGAPIVYERLLNEEKYYEIDHILPFSRTGDNNRSNLVLTTVGNNQEKGARSPYEWMKSDEWINSGRTFNWTKYCNLVNNVVRDSRKKENLLERDLVTKQKEFLERNLNDTRYMSVAIKSYIENNLKFPETKNKCHVYAFAGAATAVLRHAWGLNRKEKNGKKDRSNDLHHAVDAVVIAACSSKLFLDVSEANANKTLRFKSSKEYLKEMKPWANFTEDVWRHYESVVPTKMVNYGVTGGLYKDTLYPLGKRQEDGSWENIENGYLKVLKKKKSSQDPDNSSDDKSTVPSSNDEEVTISTFGNYVISDDGKSAKVIDGMAYLRLWLNPKKGKNGKWLAEPVYYADILAQRKNEYIPKFAKYKTARINWEKIPEEVLGTKPIILLKNNVLKLDNHIARFAGFDIANCSLKLKHLRYKEKEIKDFPALSKWGKDTSVSVLQEDVLGHCYENIEISEEDSTFKIKER